MKGLSDSLYHNNGDGTFSDVSKAAGVDDPARYYGVGVVWSDFNDDGRLDLFVADDSTPNYLYRNDGNGHFTDLSFTSGTAVSGDGGEMSGMGVAVCDYNHSGRLSIHITNFEDQNNSLYRNDGNMSFTDVSFASGIGKATVPYLGWGTGCVDLDNDGDIDVVVENLDGTPMILRNNGGNQKHWISLELVGSKSNRLAIGARVKAIAGSLVQVDEVRSGGSYLSQNDLRIHFGLGDANTVDRLEIRWPSGRTQVLSDLAANHFYVVTESAGVVAPEKARPPG